MHELILRQHGLLVYTYKPNVRSGEEEKKEAAGVLYFWMDNIRVLIILCVVRNLNKIFFLLEKERSHKCNGLIKSWVYLVTYKLIYRKTLLEGLIDFRN